MLEALKVKIKSLAEEARIIRREEQLAKAARQTQKLLSLHEHRVGTVRRASRHSQLAYGFLRYVPYEKMERVHHSQPNWQTVKKEAAKFGDEPEEQFERRWKEWREQEKSKAA